MRTDGVAERLKEVDLYPPVKAFLEGQGYAVKGEVRDCDVVALRGGEPPVIVELKTSFGLPLILQGVRRLSLTDAVYLAFPAGLGPWRRQRRDALSLCRRLGLGVLIVSPGGGRRKAGVEAALDPGPYQPRKNAKRVGLLLREFERRQGDPTLGGANRRPVMTAYRQDALRCARFIGEQGARRPAEIRDAADVDKAGAILQRDVYGWFERLERGVYGLSERGRQALELYADQLARL